MTQRTAVVAIGLAGLLVAGNAAAVDFQFYVSNLMSEHDCPVGVSTCSSDIVADSLTYEDGGIQVDITSGPGTDLIADYAPRYGGLGALVSGVPENSATNPDNLVAGQSLTFNFDRQVQLFSAEHFNSSHQQNFTPGADYRLIVDSVDLGTYAINMGAVVFDNLTGKIFEFLALENGDPFYVSAVSIAPASMPEPGTALMVGLGLVGLAGARRRSHA